MQVRPDMKARSPEFVGSWSAYRGAAASCLCERFSTSLPLFLSLSLSFCCHLPASFSLLLHRRTINRAWLTKHPRDSRIARNLRLIALKIARSGDNCVENQTPLSVYRKTEGTVEGNSKVRYKCVDVFYEPPRAAVR